MNKLTCSSERTAEPWTVLNYIFRSTYGTLYQVPEALLYQLAPVISDGLSTDFNLIETEVFEEEAISLDISVDASVRKLMIELTGNNLPEIIRILAPGTQLN